MAKRAKVMCSTDKRTGAVAGSDEKNARGYGDEAKMV